MVKATSDTCTWTGMGVDANISTTGNWTGCDNGTVPEDGDTLVFPSEPTNKSVVVDSDMAFNNVTFSGSGYTVSSAAFESLGIYSNLTINGNNNVFTGYLRFYPSTTTTFTHSGTGTDIDNYIVIQPTAADTDIVLDIDTDVTLPMISQTAVSGGSSIDTVTKLGAGTLQLTGTAIAGVTADQGIFIEEGRWRCDSTYCLGNAANVINLAEGGDAGAAELQINHSGILSNQIISAATTGESGSIIISGSPILDGAITVTGNLNLFVSGNNTAQIQSAISIANNKLLTSYGVDGYATNAIEYTGIISGNGGLIIDDAHVTLISASNTYAGTTELYNSALLTVTNNNSQGSHATGTTVNTGTSIEYDNAPNIGFGEPLTVSGNGVGGNYPGALVKTGYEMQLEGGVTMASDATFYNASEEVFEVTSEISGDYDLTLTSAEDAGGFSIEPNGDNSFGDLTINGAEVGLWGSGDITVPNNITLNAIDGQSTSLSQNNDNVIADDAVITLNNDADEEATLISNGVVETVGSITGDGKISMLDSDSSYSIGGGNREGRFTGVVEGFTNSQFEIIGGVWTFSGRSEDVGNGYSSFYVNGGKFIADASDTSLSMSPFSVSSGILGGTNEIGQVSVYGGTIAPGNSPGCLYPAGDVTFTDENSIMNVEIDGTTACSGYDVLNASGDVYLNNAVLNLEILDDYESNYGNKFTIIVGSSVIGTFTGLADGDTLSVGNNEFRINYTETNVTLTDITPADLSLSSSLANTGASIYAITLAATSLLTTSGYLSLRKRSKIKV